MNWVFLKWWLTTAVWQGIMGCLSPHSLLCGSWPQDSLVKSNLSRLLLLSVWLAMNWVLGASKIYWLIRLRWYVDGMVCLPNRVSRPQKTWATPVPPSKTLRGTTQLPFTHSALKTRSDPPQIPPAPPASIAFPCLYWSIIVRCGWCKCILTVLWC